MLQQTQVETVIPYYMKWLDKYPTLKNVAEANETILLKSWEGLGYYNRAQNIHESSKTLVEKYNCKLPKNYDDLMQLKGIGDYTASAILSIAYKKKYPAIDGNLKRIIARVYAITNSKGIIKKAKSEITQLMERHDPGDINQALMDMGRNICTPRNPKCKSCLFELSCIANQKHKIDKYPAKLHKNHIPQYDVIVGFIKKGNKILISKRKKGVLLGGLWELPGGKKNKNESSIQCLKREIKEELNIKVDIKYKIGTIKHRYSHFKINLIGYYCNYKSLKLIQFHYTYIFLPFFSCKLPYLIFLLFLINFLLKLLYMFFLLIQSFLISYYFVLLYY